MNRINLITLILIIKLSNAWASDCIQHLFVIHYRIQNKSNKDTNVIPRKLNSLSEKPDALYFNLNDLYFYSLTTSYERFLKNNLGLKTTFSIGPSLWRDSQDSTKIGFYDPDKIFNTGISIRKYSASNRYFNPYIGLGLGFGKIFYKYCAGSLILCTGTIYITKGIYYSEYLELGTMFSFFKSCYIGLETDLMRIQHREKQYVNSTLVKSYSKDKWSPNFGINFGIKL